LCGAEDAQRRGDIGTRPDGRVHETAHEAWVGEEAWGQGVRSCARGRRGSWGP
jgi:hypothetical protein